MNRQFFAPFILAVTVIVSFLSISVSASTGKEPQVLVLPLEESIPAGQKQQKILPDGFIKDFDIPAWSSKPMPKPAITSPSVVLSDAITGQVLYSKNPHTRRPNASTTKILTAILLMEHCKMTDIITASKSCSETPYTSIHLKPGEQITARDLLAAMLIRSANDSAVAIAEHISGSTDKFAQLMNQKAREIGCEDTHFVTPNGLYDPEHYTTAYDLCLMARYALQYPEFNSIIKLHKYRLNSRSKNRDDLVVFSKSKFLRHYAGADGVKSGYTKQSGNCYVGSATRGDWRLVSSVLKSENVSKDTTALMDYGFNCFKLHRLAKAGEKLGMVKVSGGSDTLVPVYAERDVNVAVPRNGAKISVAFSIPSIKAPIDSGQSLGTMTAMLDGMPIETVELRATEKVDISFLRRSIPFVIGFTLLACGMLLVKYGTTTSKDTGIGRFRVTSVLRNFNTRR